MLDCSTYPKCKIGCFSYLIFYPISLYQTQTERQMAVLISDEKCLVLKYKSLFQCHEKRRRLVSGACGTICSYWSPIQCCHLRAEFTEKSSSEQSEFVAQRRKKKYQESGFQFDNFFCFCGSSSFFSFCCCWQWQLFCYFCFVCFQKIVGLKALLLFCWFVYISTENKRLEIFILSSKEKSIPQF